MNAIEKNDAQELAAEWKRGPRVQIGRLARGQRFVSITGRIYEYIRPDGALSGAVWCRPMDGGEMDTFCKNAECLPVIA
jgi:hypothetical protein